MTTREIFKEALSALEFREAVSARCGACRIISESDLDTVNRVTRDIARITALATRLNPDYRHYDPIKELMLVIVEHPEEAKRLIKEWTT